MGTYLNPGNAGFTAICNSGYVDKTGMIGLINERIDTTKKLVCISRPRRFGKSYAAQMLCAYYDRTCDSSALFDDKEIAKNPSCNARYETYKNRYDVIYLDMTNIIGEAGNEDVLPFIRKNITREILVAYPQVEDTGALSSVMVQVVEKAGSKFVMIIDEWDAPIRELSGRPELQKEYLYFLRSLFKSSGTTDKIFAAVYMTGILPVKKDGSQSALSDFWEYSMVEPEEFAGYIGFTEQEVLELCREKECDFGMMKQWYDGYIFEHDRSIYNPNSVIRAAQSKKYKSYWKQSTATDSLPGYIGMDFDGLSKITAELLGGANVPVDVTGFSNDLVTFRDKDDVLTLLIHLGYLTYDETTGRARIPNEEIRMEFAKSIRGSKKSETIRRVRESDKLIEDTVSGNAEAVAKQIEKVHGEWPTLHYNNEQALRSTILLAYFSYGDEYLKMQELPGGKGFADIVYLPKKDSGLPVLVVELKWNKSAESAIRQIKEKRYPDVIADYFRADFDGEVLLVGISYEKDGDKKHTCVIERA